MFTEKKSDKKSLKIAGLFFCRSTDWEYVVLAFLCTPFLSFVVNAMHYSCRKKIPLPESRSSLDFSGLLETAYLTAMTLLKFHFKP